MNVPLYERIWMWAAGGIVVSFISMVFVGALGSALRPPSHVETVDPKQVFTDARFATRGVTVSPTGATVIAVDVSSAALAAAARRYRGLAVVAGDAPDHGRRANLASVTCRLSGGTGRLRRLLSSGRSSGTRRGHRGARRSGGLLVVAVSFNTI